MGLFTRSIRPPAETPNDNDALTAAPGSVGPPNVNPGDPHGVVFDYTPPDPPVFTRIVPSAWSGWPADWLTPSWSGRWNQLSDTAWACLDLNAAVLSTMPPYLVNASASLNADWLMNPSPDIYSSWEEFMRQLAWDYQLGEAFVLATAYYSTGWPSRFHVVPPWLVNVEMSRGRRVYSVGDLDVTGSILHVRYRSSVDNARGSGPLEAGRYRLLAAEVLSRYATTLASNGLIPSSILEAPVDLTPDQAAAIRDDWVAQRAANPGYPAVLSGGLKWTPTQLNPKDLALLELQQFNESRIAVLLGVPPFLVNLPTADSMTYSNVTSLFDYHWRAGLRPKAQTLMSALSGWALPRGTNVELNRDEYVQPGPLERAQTAQILNSIVDPVTGQPVLSVTEIRDAERLDNSTPQDLASGVLR